MFRAAAGRDESRLSLLGYLHGGRFVIRGLLFGIVAGFLTAWNGCLTWYDTEAKIPAPHNIPASPGAKPLALAMVDDVLHEKYLPAAGARGENAGRWRAAAEEFLAEAESDPSLLRRYDLIGNRLDEESSARARPDRLEWGSLYLSLDDPGAKMAALRQGKPADGVEALRGELRTAGITRVGAEGDWKSDAGGIVDRPLPFDEPVLALLELWKQDDAARPHLALALADIMERVGAYQTAWNALERARSMFDRFSPREEDRRWFIEHIEARQLQLAEKFNGDPRQNEQDLRAAHRALLAEGRAWQAQVAIYEEEQARLGNSPEVPGYYDEILARHGGGIAAADRLDEVPLSLVGWPLVLNMLPAMMLLGGLGTALGAAITVALRRPKSPPRRFALARPEQGE